MKLDKLTLFMDKIEKKYFLRTKLEKITYHRDKNMCFFFYFFFLLVYILIYLLIHSYIFIYIHFVFHIYNIIFYVLYMNLMYYKVIYVMKLGIYLGFFIIIYKFFSIDNECRYVILKSFKF